MRYTIRAVTMVYCIFATHIMDCLTVWGGRIVFVLPTAEPRFPSPRRPCAATRAAPAPSPRRPCAIAAPPLHRHPRRPCAATRIALKRSYMVCVSLQQTKQPSTTAPSNSLLKLLRAAWIAAPGEGCKPTQNWLRLDGRFVQVCLCIS